MGAVGAAEGKCGDDVGAVGDAVGYTVSPATVGCCVGAPVGAEGATVGAVGALVGAVGA